MSTSNSKEPVAFIGDPGQGAMIQQNLPQPGQHVGRRILKLEDIPEEWFLQEAIEVGTTWAEQFGIEKKDGNWVVQTPEQLTYMWLNRYSKTSNLSVASVQKLGATLNTNAQLALKDSGSLTDWVHDPAGLQKGEVPLLIHSVQNSVSSDTQMDPKEVTAVDAFGTGLSLLGNGTLLVPTDGMLGGSSNTEVDLNAPPQPTLFIIQSIGISSFLGDYGLGRTIKTFAMMPGEETKFYTRTWRATEESKSLASSIIDSFDESSRERFEENVLEETTDKATMEKSENWYAEGEAKASIGIAGANVSGGGGGEYSSGTEEFSRSLGEALQEHASEASSHRENSVSSSSESSVSTEEEEVIERTIKNINVRRVLNFTFRELNQEYIVKTHLKDVRIAFSNGNVGSWREVPLSSMRGLITEVIEPDRVDEVCSWILGTIAVVRDIDEEPVNVLDQIQLDKCGTDFTARKAKPGEDCVYAPPTKDGLFYYRFKRGPLGQQKNKDFEVEGLVLEERTIVMATDSIVVEALLGQVDALDSYSQDLQLEAIREKQLANDKLETALQIIQSGDPKQAKLYRQVFGVGVSNEEEIA